MSIGDDLFNLIKWQISSITDEIKTCILAFLWVLAILFLIKIFSSWTRSGSRFTRFASSIRTLHRSFRAKTNARETPFSRFWSLRWASRWRRREQVELDLQWRKGNLRQDLVDQFVERVLNRYCLQLEGARVQLVQITRVDVTDMIYSSQMKIFYNIIKLIDLLDLTLKNFTPLFTRVAYSHTYFISSNRFLLLL